MGKIKFTPEKKIEIIEAYKSGKVAYSQLQDVYGMNRNEIYRWILKYEANGIDAFVSGNRRYSKEFKIHCIEEYLSGIGSMDDIVAKYNISNREMLRKWIQRYNANKELKDYDPKREVYMANARRKTTLEERKEIVAYCITHNKDYKGTAALYGVSYSQVYSWVKKHLSNGEESLVDRRGHHKTDDEVDELERLRRENLRLKRQLEEREMVVELLKKRRNSRGCEAWQSTLRSKIFGDSAFPCRKRLEYPLDVPPIGHFKSGLLQMAASFSAASRAGKPCFSRADSRV